MGRCLEANRAYVQIRAIIGGISAVDKNREGQKCGTLTLPGNVRSRTDITEVINKYIRYGWENIKKASVNNSPEGLTRQVCYT